METKMLPEDVDSFWIWFSQNLHVYECLRPGEPAWGALNSQLEKLGIDSWEIGPAPQGGKFLAISPAGDADRLKLTRRIVETAPKIGGWTFLPAKPPKAWKRRFQWSSNLVEIDASSWRFIVLKYEDNIIEVNLVNNPLEDFADSEKIRLVEFVIESEIGEEVFLEKVHKVDICTDYSNKMMDSYIHISELLKTIKSVS